MMNFLQYTQATCNYSTAKTKKNKQEVWMCFEIDVDTNLIWEISTRLPLGIDCGEHQKETKFDNSPVKGGKNHLF